MTRLSHLEHDLVLACWDPQQRGPRPAVPLVTFRSRFRAHQAVAEADIDAGLQELEKQGYLEASKTHVQLSADGGRLAGELMVEQYRKSFEQGLVRIFESQAFGRATRRINDAGIQLLNMVDRTQLEHLCTALALQPGERVADLGCATGVLAEHLSDQFGVKVTGVDFARPAIAAAAHRTRAKASRLDFRVGDLNSIDLENGAFDVVLAVDTLYFVTDLPAVVAAMLGLVRPGGRMGIFWSQHRREGEPDIHMSPHQSDVARALSTLPCRWQSREFTTEAAALWMRSIQTYEAMAEEFAAEGSEDLHAELYSEAQRTQTSYQNHRSRRYFYLVQVPTL